MRDRGLVEYVQTLFSSGLKKCDIARKLHQDTSNVSRWCRKSTVFDSLGTPITYQERTRQLLYTQDKIYFANLDANNAKVLLATLYWCEGAKYPGTNRIEFVSSDENMQKTFITLMRIAFAKELVESKFRVMLQLHTTHNVEKSIQYWSKLLSIPPNQFSKPHITVKSASRYRHIYNGTCSIRYQDYRLLLRTMGIYDQIAKRVCSA
ncbi:MAG TPA: hypothetical protein VLH94_02130 [Spirochaetia bacterium]|nr:hypothetical protein [Spirochaetia bacterium]